jgi:hypothetical protein
MQITTRWVLTISEMPNPQADSSTNRQLTKSAHKMIEAMAAQDQPRVGKEFLTAIETPLLRIVRPRSNR